MINDQDINISNEIFRIKSSQRQLSRSNHSNKSEEVSSTIHKQINIINMFQNENIDPINGNNSLRQS